jgi:hypothetical protein
VPISSAGHRVIGIRHALNQLKTAGLVEQDTLYPRHAVQDVQSEILAVAERWYRVGARRGALEILEAILDGDLEVHVNNKGEREIVASKNSVTWSKRLNVNVGNTKQQIPEQTYELTLKDLEFDV